MNKRILGFILALFLATMVVSGSAFTASAQGAITTYSDGDNYSNIFNDVKEQTTPLNLIVVLVNYSNATFTDGGTTNAANESYWSNKIFGTGITDPTAPPTVTNTLTVNDWFKANSNGQFYWNKTAQTVDGVTSTTGVYSVTLPYAEPNL